MWCDLSPSSHRYLSFPLFYKCLIYSRTFLCHLLIYLSLLIAVPSLSLFPLVCSSSSPTSKYTPHSGFQIPKTKKFAHIFFSNPKFLWSLGVLNACLLPDVPLWPEESPLPLTSPRKPFCFPPKRRHLYSTTHLWAANPKSEIPPRPDISTYRPGSAYSPFILCFDLWGQTAGSALSEFCPSHGGTRSGLSKYKWSIAEMK